jgi:hypothetical protein
MDETILNRLQEIEFDCSKITDYITSNNCPKKTDYLIENRLINNRRRYVTELNEALNNQLYSHFILFSF